MLNIKKMLTKILDALKCDYIVEQGTSGNWTYRKWNSGILEQWYRGSPGAYTVGTARGYLYSGGDVTYTYPIPFVGYYTVCANVTLSTDYYAVWCQTKGYSETSIAVRIVASSSIAQSTGYMFHIHAVGTWK